MAAIVFAVALIASGALHMIGFVGSSFLSMWLEDKKKGTSAAPVEFFDLESDEVGSPTSEILEPPKENQEPKRRTRAEKKKPKEEVLPKPKPKPQTTQVEVVEAKPQRPEESKLAIRQESDNPEKENPDARFIAEENRTVKEETVARSRSLDGRENESSGDEKHKERAAGRQEHAQETTEDQGAESESEKKVARAESARAREASAPAAGQAFEGAFGTLRLRNGSSRNPNDFKLSPNTMRAVVGDGKLARERERYRKGREGKKRMVAFGKSFDRFKKAAENYVPNVKPGNQTALGARANPFAAYLRDVHVKIHQRFADGFLPSLPSHAGNPMADPSLMTRLEIVIDAKGKLVKTGVVKTSGLSAFDFGAWSSVENAAPFPKPPHSILSPDGNVYFHWGFYRNRRQCGTFNAQPFMLEGPAPDAGQPDDRDRPSEERESQARDWGRREEPVTQG